MVCLSKQTRPNDIFQIVLCYFRFLLLNYLYLFGIIIIIDIEDEYQTFTQHSRLPWCGATMAKAMVCWYWFLIFGLMERRRKSDETISKSREREKTTTWKMTTIAAPIDCDARAHAFVCVPETRRSFFRLLFIRFAGNPKHIFSIFSRR